MAKDHSDDKDSQDPGRGEEETRAYNEAKYAAELHLLTKIATVSAAQARDFAEAYALLTGTLNAQPVRIKPSK
ncbi:hypothetical protein V6S67_18355 [Arthrobacter sp. Soc17.1.1.1]|uniref:hypothetical protein n=1 Tax=Arthrobacter sp. Soc17.1.1.1 TaxID=3121277 RepID=UPI002FE455BC